MFISSISRPQIFRGFVVLAFLHFTPALLLQSMPPQNEAQKPQAQQPQSPNPDQVQEPAQQSAGASKPTVRTPVSPNVREVDLGATSQTKTVKKWEPGSPIRVVDDLKTSEQAQEIEKNAPVARTPVSPQKQDQNLADVPKQPAAKPGDPVRVVDDLKQDPDRSPKQEQPAEKPVPEPKKP